MKKVVFLGGKEIGYNCLEYLLRNRNRLDVDVVGVLASGRMLFEESLSIEKLCASYGAPYLRDLDEYLRLGDFDILISVQYHQILKAEHIEKSRQIAINLHMAPLPEYRGCNQFSFAILDSAKEFGTTIHRLELGIDSGAILFEKRFPIPTDCFVSDLYRMTYDASLQLFKESIKSIVDGNYVLIPQETFVGKRPTSIHFRRELEVIRRLGEDWSIERKKRHFRATYFPPLGSPFLMRDGIKQELTLDWYGSL